MCEFYEFLCALLVFAVTALAADDRFTGTWSLRHFRIAQGRVRNVAFVDVLLRDHFPVPS